MSQLLGPKPLRALLFVHTLTSQGVLPSKSDVNAFLGASQTTAWDWDTYADEQLQSTVDYLLDARLLLLDRETLTLTPAGNALLQASVATPAPATVKQAIEVVGRMSDPFVYAELLNRVDDVSGSLVIDPFLHPADLTALLRLRNVKRVLTRDTYINGMAKVERAHKLQIALGANADVELRFAPARPHELHDRLVLPAESGEALVLGTSLGGTQLTVITRIGTDPSSVLRAHYDDIWGRSTPLEPITRLQDV